MFEDNDDIIRYFLTKGLLALLFAENFELVFSEVGNVIPIESPDDIDLVEAFKRIVEIYHDIFDEKMKANVKAFIQYLRFDYAEKNPSVKGKVYSIVNDILELLSTCSDRDILKFGVSQAYHRHYSMTSILGAIPFYRNLFERIKFDNVIDFNILIAQSSLFTDEDFESEAASMSELENDYTTNLCAIFCECPELMNDTLFMKRSRMVLSLIEEHLNTTSPQDIKHYGLVKRNLQYCLRKTLKQDNQRTA